MGERLSVLDMMFLSYEVTSEKTFEIGEGLSDAIMWLDRSR